MKTKHTPGPWTASNGGPFVTVKGSDPNGSCGDSVIAVTANTFSHLRFAAEVGSIEDKENARLIAAAPDLLTALEHAHATIENLRHYEPGTADSALALIAVALSVARGS